MSQPRIAILGGGPIGIEAALYARLLGYPITLYERGSIGANLRSWGFVQLFTPWKMNATPLGLQELSDSEWFKPLQNVCPSGEELYERYLEPLARSPKLYDCIRTGHAVLSVGRDDFNKSDEIGTGKRSSSAFRLLVRHSSGKEQVDRADIVLDCTGTYSRHRWAGRGGIPAPGETALANRIFYTIPDCLSKHRTRFANRHTLLLGCGYSAATVLFNLQTLARDYPKTKVSWAIRKPGQAMQTIADDPLPARRALVEASLRLSQDPPGWLQFLGSACLERVDNGAERIGVTLNSAGTDLALVVDEFVAMVGYIPDSSIYEQLQIHQCYATAGPIKLSAALLGEDSSDCMKLGSSIGPETLQNPEPNFFILGAKSYGTNSNFLMQIGHKQIRDCFKLISGDEKLDLYK